MNVSMLLDMAAEGFGDRVVLGGREANVTAAQLRARAAVAAETIRHTGADAVVYLAANGPAFPVALFAAARAGVPLVPLNYRLGRDQLDRLLAGHKRALGIADPAHLDALTRHGLAAYSTGEWLANARHADDGDVPDTQPDPDAPAVIIYTSGSTSAPKGVRLAHDNLVSYVLGTVEFMGASGAEASLVSVPPYHVAGVANVLTNLYAGRRVFPLETFSPDAWLKIVSSERITNALVVPTMLARIMESGTDGRDVSTLRTLAYGGAPMPPAVIERALRAWPHVDFVNAYGLTETSSTIALLGPEDHRIALASSDPVVRDRLKSVGHPMPGVELEIRDVSGDVVPDGTAGRIWVKGPQVSGEYTGSGPTLDPRGFFDTRDEGRLDRHGFLYIGGRTDDTIIRGAENIAPAEIDEVLLGHPDVLDAAVVGVPDQEWGQRIEAAVVLRAGTVKDAESLRRYVRDRLRGSRTPDHIVFWSDLPRTETGKLIRRQVVSRIVAGQDASPPGNLSVRRTMTFSPPLERPVKSITATATSAVITLDRDSGLPLYRQVEDGFSSAILTGVLKAGTRLPSTRSLAESLGVSRNTIMLAFDELFSQGLLATRRGTGTFVAEGYPTSARASSQPERGAKPEPSISRRGSRIGGLGLIRVRAYAPARAFRAGVPALDAFVLEQWRQEAAKAQRWSTVDMLGYGDPGGYRPLRQAIAEFLGATRAVCCSAGQVVIVSGSQQGLDLCARLLTDPGDRVLMEDPSRSGAAGAFAAADVDMVSVPVDQDGLQVQAGVAREPNARAAYVSPSHQYPLGVTMSLDRRAQLVEWARQANAWVVEDDFDCEFRFEGSPLPSIQGMATERVVYVGSFSRALFPSLRLGYVVVPDGLVETFQRARALMDRQSPIWEQATLANFISDGHLDRHLRRMRGIYLARRAALLHYSERYLMDVLSFRGPAAGLHIAGFLPPTYDARRAEDAAAKYGIDVLSLTRLTREVELPPALLLGFGVVPESSIESAVATLARALATLDTPDR